MKILYYDCFSGISGDMNLGALIELGVDKEYLIKEISKLKLDSEYEIKIEKGIKKGIAGTKFDVIIKAEIHHEEEHKQHHHRNLKDIESIIVGSELSENIKKMSMEIFMKVAKAEALVHGKDINDIHFHEVGAIDSIIDIVGAAIALNYLKVDKIISTPVQVGGGFVNCAHGIIPVPAPATVEILKEIPIKSGIVQYETTTPTGAAILAANVNEFTDKMDFKIEKIGYGIGNRDLDIPNVLRVFLGEDIMQEKNEEQYIFEANIDDMNPELYGYIEEKLFNSGALDVFKTPIIMKKGRPAIKLSVLTSRDKEREVMDVIFKETTTIGLRKYKIDKIMLEREFFKINTIYGEVTVKKSYYNGELVRAKAEYEDCNNLALKNNVPISRVYEEVNKIINN